jgi:catechol 2,3-dioxygenase-like lactoylglutathione lyase family enzyme
MHVCELMYVSTTVADLRRAETFYGNGLGFARVGEAVNDDPAWNRLIGVASSVTARALRLRLGAQEIELVSFDPPGLPYPEPRAANDRRFQHIAIVTDDIEGAWSRLQRLSPTHISVDGPQLLPANTGGVSAVKFRDPDGHPLELLYLPPGVGDAAWHYRQGSEPMGYDHSAIVVEDVERSIAFYTGLLGFQVGGRSLNTGVEQDRLDGLSNCVVDVVGLEPADVPTPHLELLCYRQPPAGAPIDDVGAHDIASTRQVHRIDDLDGLVDHLKDAGTTFVSPDIVLLKSGHRASAVRDPDGHMIVLTQ